MYGLVDHKMPCTWEQWLDGKGSSYRVNNCFGTATTPSAAAAAAVSAANLGPLTPVSCQWYWSQDWCLHLTNDMIHAAIMAHYYSSLEEIYKAKEVFMQLKLLEFNLFNI